MANPVMGEVAFEAAGKSYTFKLGTYAQAVLERRVKMPAGRFFQRDKDTWGVDDILAVMYAGLYRAHKLSEEQVADIIDELGFERVGEIIRQAIEIAAPKSEDGANPPKAEVESATGLAS